MTAQFLAGDVADDPTTTCPRKPSHVPGNSWKPWDWWRSAGGRPGTQAAAEGVSSCRSSP